MVDSKVLYWRMDPDIENRDLWEDRQFDTEFGLAVSERFKRLRKAVAPTQQRFVDSAASGKLPRLGGTSTRFTLKTVQRIEQGRIRDVSYDNFRNVLSAVSSPDEFFRGLTEDYRARRTIDVDSLKLYRNYVQKQRDAILNSPLLQSGLVNAASLRFIWPELIVPTPLTAWRTHQEVNLFDLSESISDQGSAFVIGKPGSGKSTTLRYLFLSLTEPTAMENRLHNPVYFHLADLLTQKEPAEVIQSLFLPGLNPILLLDGGDEVSIEKFEEFIEEQLRDLYDQCSIFVACRKQHFLKYFLSHEKVSANFSNVFELQDWQPDQHSLPYCREYLSKANWESGYSDFSKAIDSHKESSKFLVNPFQLNLLLYLFIEGKIVSLQNGFQLYSAFYRQWIDAELERARCSVSKGEVERAHLNLAVSYYRNRNLALRFTDLKTWEEIRPDVKSCPAFSDILQSRLDPLSFKPVVSGFRHESLVEFLLAKRVVDAALSEEFDLAELLRVEYSNEVNAFIRDAWNLLSREQTDHVKTKLTDIYHGGYSNGKPAKDSGKGAKSLEPVEDFVREQAIYYIGRLNLGRCPEVLRTAHKTDPDPLLRRAAALSAILLGCDETEHAYLAKLVNDALEAELNRSVQMVYFGDATGSIGDFRDPGDTPWNNTRKAILDRLTGNTWREQRLRKWDLITLLSFLQSRLDDRPL